MPLLNHILRLEPVSNNYGHVPICIVNILLHQQWIKIVGNKLSINKKKHLILILKIVHR